MNIPQTDRGYEPNSEIDLADGFVPTEHDDVDTFSQMSDIPLQLPASANRCI